MPAGKLLPVRIGDVYVETLPAAPAVGSEPTSVVGRERPQEAAGVEQVADVFSCAQETILSIATTTAAVLEKAGRAAVHHESLEVEFGIAFSGWSSRRRSLGLQSACQRSSGTRGVLRRHSTSSSPCSGVSSTMSFGCRPSFARARLRPEASAPGSESWCCGGGMSVVYATSACIRVRHQNEPIRDCS